MKNYTMRFISGAMYTSAVLFAALAFTASPAAANPDPIVDDGTCWDRPDGYHCCKGKNGTVCIGPVG